MKIIIKIRKKQEGGKLGWRSRYSDYIDHVFDQENGIRVSAGAREIYLLPNVRTASEVHADFFRG
jgi:hypothetical protein